jgi:hypothetical protein
MCTLVIVTARRAERAAFCCACFQLTSVVGIVRAAMKIIELSISSPDEFPKQRSPACTFDDCFDL